MPSPGEASSSESNGQAVNPMEHPNICDGGGNADEAGKDEDMEDAEPVDEENAVNPPNPGTSSKAKKAFGMRRAQPTARKGNDPSNYEDRFPEDPMYEETAPNARVWMTHQAESAIHDANMVEEIRDNVDVLLVFAGLFSAVVTAFVVQTSQSLQADYAQISASLLFELLLVQRAIANGSPVDVVPVSSLNPQTAFVPTATDVWVNGLWFSSLFLSLTTALVAVLVKQWLHHYVVLPSGTPRQRCFVRQYRYLGFQKWRVEVIVGLLPWVVWTGTVLLIVAYMTMTILPMCFPQCPYRTPLCDLVYSPYVYIASLVQMHYHRLQLLQRRCKKQVQSLVGRVTRINDPGRNHITAEPNSLKQLELEAVGKASLRLSVEALQWLLSVSSNPAVQSIVVESIGGLPMEALAEVKDVFRRSPSIVDVRGNLLTLIGRKHDPTDREDRSAVFMASMLPGTKRKFERLLRSGMFISTMDTLWSFVDIWDQPDEFGPTLLTQIPKLCRYPIYVKFTPTEFLHNILSLKTPKRFPPIVWANLIQLATQPWDPDLFNINDEFTRFLCTVVTRIGVVRTSTPKQQLFASPLVVDFVQAVEYFPEIALKSMMCWMLRFDLLLGERLECRMLAASIHLMIHRLSRSAADTNTDEPLDITMLVFLFGTLSSYTRKNSEDVWKIVDSVIVNTPIFSQHETSKYDQCFGIILGHYSAFVTQYDFPSRIHAPSSALQLLVTFLTTQWSTLHTSTRTRATLTFLVTCLEWRFRPAYDVFYQQRCLKFLAMQSVSSWSVSLLKAYIVGITVAIQSRDDPEENDMISQAIDHLHEAENLFFVCFIFAMYPHDSVPQARGNPDIMTALARIRPLDPAWVNCRQKLRELAEDESFLAGLGGEESDPEERRCNMRVALERLEVFFSDIPSQSTASLELSGLPPQPQLARVGRLLPSSWRRPRQQDEEHQLTEHV